VVQRLNRFSVGQTAKVIGMLYGLMGIVALPLFLAFSIYAPPESRFGIGFAILVPVLYAVCGFIFTAVGCMLYNFVAGLVGGIEVQLDGTA
jgi:hypothetical protein